MNKQISYSIDQGKILGQKNAMTVHDIFLALQEISKVTGVSWNKRYKKSHGPINKVIHALYTYTYCKMENW